MRCLKKRVLNKKKLKIGLITYRGNPSSGGQGIYINYLSRALSDLGHEVTVISGPPYPEIRKDINLIKTGYNAIDKFAGGLTRGEITIIGGRPGHGKTTMMVNMLASLISNGSKVVLFNRELPNIEVIKKLICLESQKLSYSLIRQGIHNESSLQQLEQVKQIIQKKYIYILCHRRNSNEDTELKL